MGLFNRKKKEQPAAAAEKVKAEVAQAASQVKAEAGKAAEKAKAEVKDAAKTVKAEAERTTGIARAQVADAKAKLQEEVKAAPAQKAAAPAPAPEPAPAVKKETMSDNHQTKEVGKMLFQTTAAHEELRAKVRAFAEKEIAPIASMLDAKNEFPDEQIKKLGANGWMGHPYPKEYGGAGLDVLSYAIAVEELALREIEALEDIAVYSMPDA